LSGRLHYFHTHPILNYHYFIAADNVLDLNERTEAVLAVAGGKGARTYLLVVKYLDDVSADAAFRHFAQSIIPGARPDGSQEMPDKTWTAGGRRGAHVIIVFKSVSRETALASVGDVERLLETERR
jgi:hypothetical protein